LLKKGEIESAWRDERQKATIAFATKGRIGGDGKRGGKWEENERA
jgi:hypothetical protein